MKYLVTYEISENAKGLYAVVEPEKKDLVTKRAQVDILLEGDVCKFIIKAKDFTAFRAMNNSVMRLITIYNKMDDLETDVIEKDVTEKDVIEK